MGQEGSPYDWDVLGAGPISTTTFTYRWKSQATLKTGGIETPVIRLQNIVKRCKFTE